METESRVIKIFDYLGENFIAEFNDAVVYSVFPAKTEIMKEGQYVKYIPIVLEGLVKIYSNAEEKELLYYFISPEQSCIMSFSCIFNDHKSRISAMAEEDTRIAFVSSEKIKDWIIKYPEINRLFYEQYEFRFTHMMEMVYQAVFEKLDKRLLKYLKHRSKVTGKSMVKISHKEIANDLGSAREVISRLLKKFENEGVIQQTEEGIELLEAL